MIVADPNLLPNTPLDPTVKVPLVEGPGLFDALATSWEYGPDSPWTVATLCRHEGAEDATVALKLLADTSPIPRILDPDGDELYASVTLVRAIPNPYVPPDDKSVRTVQAMFDKWQEVEAQEEWHLRRWRRRRQALARKILPRHIAPQYRYFRKQLLVRRRAPFAWILFTIWWLC